MGDVVKLSDYRPAQKPGESKIRAVKKTPKAVAVKNPSLALWMGFAFGCAFAGFFVPLVIVGTAAALTLCLSK